MGGHTESGICPACGYEDMFTYSNYKPHDYVEGHCLECGFHYYTKTRRWTLEMLNNERKDKNESEGLEVEDEGYLPPLTSLPEVDETMCI
jgi:Zn ribbon nucleic-acid-binding protein